MAKKRNNQAKELDLRLSEAILGIQSRKFKSAQAAAVALGLRPNIVQRRLRGVAFTKVVAHRAKAYNFKINNFKLNNYKYLNYRLGKTRGSGLQPFQPQTVIRAATLPTTDVATERPYTPTEHDIFEKVFLNSSPPDFQTLHKANTVLSSTISRGILDTPTKRYIHKLADETERLNTRHILQQRETENLRSIIQKRRTQNKGKRAVLKGQFHISTKGLRSQVAEAEEATAAASQRPRTTPRLNYRSIIEEMDDKESEESNRELSDDDIDELGL
ncbi:hypothetical protein V492_00084 [Pseudogymnoascus sp. VKM F-4246]|nr:hypothetical protein V492_00084 [Pseudogymnoascus sp. VKM F-4246]